MEAEGISNRGSVSTSPEFEFWMIRNPSNPQPGLMSADELFADGILLPLHHRPSASDLHSPPVPSSISPGISPDVSSSKRWRDIFRKTHRKIAQDRTKRGGAPRSAELNINLWPFSRSRSAGTSTGRPRVSGTNRKISSAPCSRSNSAGESKYRKWPSSPSRPTVHLGRANHVWPIRRHAVRSSTDVNGGKAKVLNLNVPTCMGYHRQQMSCSRSAVDVNGDKGGGDRRNCNDDGGGNEIEGVGAGGGNFFKFRGLFVKKVH